MPPGLTLSSNGTVFGTPTIAGSSACRIRVSDTLGASATSSSSSLTVLPAPSLNASALLTRSAVVSAPYSAALSASGGSGGYVYSAVSALPPGLDLNPATGVVSGTPTSAGSYSWQFTVTDLLGVTATSSASSVTIGAAPLVSVPSAVATAATSALTVDVPFAANLSCSGGSGSFTYSVVSGTLCTGLSLTSGGLLAGTPTAYGTYTFMLQCTDSLGGFSKVIQRSNFRFFFGKIATMFLFA